MKPIPFSLLVLICLVPITRQAWAQADVPPASGSSAITPSETPRLNAAPAEAPIALDGRLDEAAWMQAEPISGFRQFEPNEGAPATQRTEVRVLYGDDNLYVGATLYDDDPAAIKPSLGRRDDYNRADWFLVSIDSYLDRRTAYTFGLNAAGVQFDAIYTGDSGGPGGGGGGSNAPRGMDESWDAIWYSDVRVTDRGWIVEMRIPYSMLRFSEAAAQTWGVHFRRRIPRLGEQDEWPLVPRTERENLVARFGLLQGIAGVAPRRNVQARPYTVTRLQMEEDPDVPGEPVRDGGVDVGGDVKVGLGPNVTLDATINPDFGQVESDPAVLNLTAFETFFDERRPFFVEGIQIYEFSAGPGRLLYTRRIGAESRIIGAAKLSGRTASGLSFGLLGATTGDGFDPTRHYGVGRVSQQIGTYSSAGGILTVFDGNLLGRDGRRRSLAGGTDWDVRLLGNRYGIEGFASVTHRRATLDGLDPETGFAGKVWLRKRQGAWTGFVGGDVFSDQFNPNDVGQLRTNNFFAILVSVEHEINGGRPFGPFLRASAETFNVQQIAYRDGLNLGQSIEVGSRWVLRGFQQIELGVAAANPFGGYDLYETRGLDPWAKPFEIGVGAEIETDDRRSWEIEPEFGVLFQEGGGRGYEAGLRGNWNVGTRLSLEGNLEGAWEKGYVAWSSNETFLRTDGGWMIGQATGLVNPDPGGFAAFDDEVLLETIFSDVTPFDADRFYVPVFGARDTRSLDLTLRGTVTFIPNLSLQLYSQLFLARGRYDRFQILQNADALAPFSAFPKRDEFAFNSLLSNAVLRWEYRPGSALFLVWSHGRRADDALNPLAPWGPSPFARPLGEQVAETFGLFPSNVFLIKLNYTFLY